MAVLDEVEAALGDDHGQAWQRALAVALAGEMDAKPNASIAGQLRQLMDDIGASAVQKKADVSDDLTAKRAARRNAAG